LDDKYDYPPQGGSGIVRDYETFEKDLKRVLGVNIQIPFDPQKVELYAPNFYTYIYDGKNYLISANLYNPNDRTIKIDCHYFKYELGSILNKTEK
jgi:hypothetical protein